ncbi:MAG: LuxR family transcriptional regulator [Rhodobiaceae bacterium]|nr:LuxR family transcriptional regulator [Rhodobiaceae bacterium]
MQNIAQSAEEFENRIAHYDDVAAVGVALREAILPHGFSASAAGAFVPSLEGARPIFYFQDWPEEWLALYARENFVNHDLVVIEARASIAAFFWSEAIARRTQTVAQRRVFEAAAERGWHDGFAVPFHGPAGYFGLLVMAGIAQTITVALRQHLTLLAIAAHNRCRTLSARLLPSMAEFRLTSREVECLHWVASGDTDDEIGARLGLSSRTVKDYVDNARRKTGARNRAQAVAILIAAGLM